jgi:hypothetical protein
MQARILAHVESLEYTKELARQIAEQLVDQYEVKEIIDDPQGFTDSILAALVLLLLPHAKAVAAEAADYAGELALADISGKDLAAIVDESQAKFLAFAQPALQLETDRLAARVQDMLAGGAALTTLTAVLASPATKEALLAPMIGLTRRLAASWIQFVERDVNDAAVLATERAQLMPVTLTWVAVMDRNTCDGEVEFACAPRHGMAATLAEWSAMGMPGSSVLICSMHSPRGGSACRCLLAINEMAAGVAAPVRAAQAIRAGKDRAIAAMGRAA